VQTFARDMVEVRGRVNGYIEKRSFLVGSDVKAGQELYVLDLRPCQAEVARNHGLVAQAGANLEFARKQVALAQAEAGAGAGESAQSAPGCRPAGSPGEAGRRRAAGSG
jgi:multidrug efflux pump subunit AcrA (membrane-fusion protein)